MQLTKQIPDDPPRIGAKVLLLAIIPVPPVARARLTIHVPCLADVHALYDNKTPTVRKVIKLIRADAQNGDENKIVLHMKLFIKGISK